MSIEGWRTEFVALNVMDSQHYQLWSPEGGEEWEKLLLFDRHTIEISSKNEGQWHEQLNNNKNNTVKRMSNTYTVSMFHQLKCVDILRRTYISLRFGLQNEQTSNHRSASRNRLVQHCINYLRQTFLCHSQIQLEPHTRTVEQNGYDALCFDWGAVYAKFEQISTSIG